MRLILEVMPQRQLCYRCPYDTPFPWIPVCRPRSSLRSLISMRNSRRAYMLLRVFGILNDGVTGRMWDQCFHSMYLYLTMSPAYIRIICLTTFWLPPWPRSSSSRTGPQIYRDSTSCFMSLIISRASDLNRLNIAYFYWGIKSIWSSSIRVDPSQTYHTSFPAPMIVFISTAENKHDELAVATSSYFVSYDLAANI